MSADDRAELETLGFRVLSDAEMGRGCTLTDAKILTRHSSRGGRVLLVVDAGIVDHDNGIHFNRVAIGYVQAGRMQACTYVSRENVRRVLDSLVAFMHAERARKIAAAMPGDDDGEAA